MYRREVDESATVELQQGIWRRHIFQHIILGRVHRRYVLWHEMGIKIRQLRAEGFAIGSIEPEIHLSINLHIRPLTIDFVSCAQTIATDVLKDMSDAFLATRLGKISIPSTRCVMDPT